MSRTALKPNDVGSHQLEVGTLRCLALHLSLPTVPQMRVTFWAAGHSRHSSYHIDCKRDLRSNGFFHPQRRFLALRQNALGKILNFPSQLYNEDYDLLPAPPTTEHFSLFLVLWKYYRCVDETGLWCKHNLPPLSMRVWMAACLYAVQGFVTSLGYPL